MASQPQDPELYYQTHILCCCNQRPEGHPRSCCGDRGGKELMETMTARIAEMGVENVTITEAGCMERCELGPTMVIYPDAVWYSYSNEADIDEIVGISVPMGPQLLPALRLAPLINRASDPARRRVVLGGPTLSLLGDAELERLFVGNPTVDCVVRYDGELSLLALIAQTQRGEWAPENVSGTVSYRGGQLLAPSPSPGPKLNSLPTPAYTPASIELAPDAWLGVLQARD